MHLFAMAIGMCVGVTAGTLCGAKGLHPVIGVLLGGAVSFLVIILVILLGGG